MATVHPRIVFFDDHNKAYSFEEANEEVRLDPARGHILYRITRVGKETFNQCAGRMYGKSLRWPPNVKTMGFQIVNGELSLDEGLAVYQCRTDRIKVLKIVQESVASKLNTATNSAEYRRLSELLPASLRALDAQ